jgi:hypothetical protein
MKACGQVHTPAGLPPVEEPMVSTGKDAEWSQDPVTGDLGLFEDLK